MKPKCSFLSDYIVSIEDAKEQLETAKEVVALVEQYLKALDE